MDGKLTENSCRLCLVSMGKMPITVEFLISSRISELLNIELLSEHSILPPDKVCVSCHGKLEMIFNFRQQIICTENHIKRLMASIVADTDDDESNGDETTDIQKTSQANEEEHNEEYVLADENVKLEVMEEEFNIPHDVNGGGGDGDFVDDVKEENTKSDWKKKKTKTFVRKECKSKTTRKPRQYKNMEFVCSECGKCLKTEIGYKSHMRGHVGERPFACDICDKQFTSNGTMLAHKLIHSEDKAIVCEICSKQFVSITYLNQHKRTHVPDSERILNCSECDKVFRTKRFYELHLMKHTGVKSIKCTDCGRMFFTKRDLSRHTSTFHLKIKKHVCSVCDKAFSNSGNLASHFRIHTGEKPYACKYCSSRYNQSTPLIRHMKKHEERGDPMKEDPSSTGSIDKPII